MEKRTSHDFVLVGGTGGRLVSDNARTAGDFVLVHESPISKRRVIRASKELNASDREALQALAVARSTLPDEESNASSDFVLVHESPISKRREIRASKELNASDREALQKLTLDIELDADDEDTAGADEVGAAVAPSPLRSKTASFKNGRRVPDVDANAPLKAKVAEPASPTGVDAFFNDIIAKDGSAKHLLGSLA